MKGLREFLEITSEGRAQFFVDELTSASQDDQRTLMNFIQGGICCRHFCYNVCSC